MAHNTAADGLFTQRGLPMGQHLKGKPLTRNRRFPEWQREYEEALLEPDARLVPGRVALAEAAILKRFRMLANRPEHKEEIAAISDVE